MKLIRIRCLVCLAWRGAFRSHCPQCGAYKIGHKHYAVSPSADKIRELRTVCGMPLALRFNYFSR